MKAKCEGRVLIVGPCVAWLWLAALPPIFAQEPKPPAKMPDIQGTWDLVSWEKNGEKEERKKVRFFISAETIYADGVPLPDDKSFTSWPYELRPGDQPNVASLNLIRFQGREMVPGLCGVDGATLRIVLGRVTKTHALPLDKVEVDRPTEFASRPGTDQLLFVLKRAAAADDPISLLRKLGGNDTITVWRGVYLDSDQATNDDLAIIKKLPSVSTLTLRRCRITDAGQVHLKDLADLQYLILADMPITDAGLVHLEGLPKLQELTVACPKVSGPGLKGLTKLKELGLENSAVTDADLAHLKGLTRLECLNLGKTAITDAGLVHLKPLINLDRLFLDSTQVTDAGLEHLHGLTGLRNLRIPGTKVTDKGVRALKAALPDLEEIAR
jgi:Leucine-rich repeat (LRR) protein